jgi:hypothetical protein
MKRLELETLVDLRKIDACVRLRCEECGAEQKLDREELIKAAGWQMHIHLAAYKRSCLRAACEGWAVYAGAIPWCEDAARLRRRVFTNTLLNLACTVLKNAAYRRARDPEQQTAVRLALRVLQSHGADAAHCTAFWTKVTKPTPSPWDACHNELNWIVLALLERGWSINAELR